MIATRLSVLCRYLTILLAFLTSLLYAQEADSIPALTPRPSPIADMPVPLISLNGIWLFRSDSSTTMAEVGVDRLGGWSPISVPSEWVMQSFAVKPGTYAAYRRTFDMPGDWAGQRIKLRFDGVHSSCHIGVNGSEVGEHEGGFTVFEFDITRHVRPGSNSITVAVKSESVADTLASASQYAAHQLGGITRKVTLFAVPELHIASLVAKTTFDRQGENANLVIELAVANESAHSTPPAGIAFELVDPSGKMVPMAPAAATIGSLSAGELIRHSTSIRVADVKKWDPEHPRLYSFKVHLSQNGRSTETIVQHIGFRQVEVRGNRVFVNGHPIKLHGVNRHEVHPMLGRSLTPELWREDAEIFRSANVNYIRTSHYPPAEEFLDACDELGLFVECEAALCWVQHGANDKWKEWDYRDAKFLPYLLRANLENVAANRNHPSIIIWSLANESYWSPSFARVHDVLRRVDPSRLTSFHDQCWGEYNNGGSKAQIAVYHYPGEDGPARCNREPRPVLFGEYTHVETYNRKECVTDPGIRDDWGRPFERMYDLVYRNPGCLGGAIWAGIDEVFSLPGGRTCGYGPWGIIDGWRRPKPEYWHVKKSYSPVKVIDREYPPRVRNGVLEVPLENRYDFTNLSEVEILWNLGDEGGKASVDIRPHERGVLRIRPKYLSLEGKRLTLTFIDPRGFVCETEELPAGPGQSVPVPHQSVETRTSLDSTDRHFIVKGKEYTCEIDRMTGRIVRADVQGRSVLAGGPELMILPLQSDECLPNYHADESPLNNTCTRWRQRSIHAAILENGAVQIQSEGTYAEAAGASTVTFHGDGKIVVEYNFRALQEVNPRQWGVVFYAPPEIDSLSWQRHGQWNTYPPDHIGRRSGSARAHPSPRDSARMSWIPRGGWSADANELGTNDFRSTKSDLISASLLSSDGHGISLPAHRPGVVRAFVDGQKIGLLVAGFNTGGGEQFFAPHYARERQPLKKGDMIEGKFTLHIIHR